MGNSVHNGCNERYSLGKRKTLLPLSLLSYHQVRSLNVIHKHISLTVSSIIEYLIHMGKGRMFKPLEPFRPKGDMKAIFPTGISHFFEDKALLGVTLITNEID